MTVKTTQDTDSELESKKPICRKNQMDIQPKA